MLSTPHHPTARAAFFGTLILSANAAVIRADKPHAAWTQAFDLTAAAFVHPQAPEVVVHAPAHWISSPPLQLNIFLHGWNGCANVLMRSGPSRCAGTKTLPTDSPREGWGLAVEHDAANTLALFVIAQLAYLKRDTSPGRFIEQGMFRTFLEETLTAISKSHSLSTLRYSDIGSLTLLAHSAGYRAALAILENGDVADKVANVVLFDALYAEHSRFIEWASGAPHRLLISYFQGHATTYRLNKLLVRDARSRLGTRAVYEGPATALSDNLANRRVVVLRSSFPHGSIPKHHLKEVLMALSRVP